MIKDKIQMKVSTECKKMFSVCTLGCALVHVCSSRVFGSHAVNGIQLCGGIMFSFVEKLKHEFWHTCNCTIWTEVMNKFDYFKQCRELECYSI